MSQNSGIVAAFGLVGLCVVGMLCAASVDSWGPSVENVANDIGEAMTPEPVKYTNGESWGSIHYGNFHVISCNYDRGEVVVVGREFPQVVPSDAEQHYKIQVYDEGGGALITYYGETSISDPEIWVNSFSGGNSGRKEYPAIAPIQPMAWGDMQITNINPTLSQFTLQRTKQGDDGCYDYLFSSVDVGTSDWLHLKLCANDMLVFAIDDAYPYE